MLNSGEKKNILTLVLSEKKIRNETKNHNPPFKLNGRSLIKLFSYDVKDHTFILQTPASTTPFRLYNG